MKKFAVLLAISLCFVSVASAQDEISEDEYKVYGDWMKDALIKADTRQLLLMNTTWRAPDDFKEMPKHRRKKLSLLRSSTLKDYRLKNRLSFPLQNRFNIAAEIRFLTFDEFHFPFESIAAAEKYGKEFGADDRITLSRVGFSKDGAQALLHVNYKSNVMHKFDRGFYFILSKEKDKWTLKQWGKSWEY
jgi:hypothetical protein